jgi:hypothetical protein
MRKKLVFGSVLILILFLSMPSISAIQNKVYRDESIRKLIEKISYEDIRELLESYKLDRVKHPLLYFFIIFSLYSRIIRIEMLAEYSYDGTNWPYYEIKNPVLYLRLLILYTITMSWILFWKNISEDFEWNWNYL